MSCYIYLYDKNNEELPCPAMEVSSDHEGVKLTDKAKINSLLSKISSELCVKKLSAREREAILTKRWRGEIVTPQERDAINLEWVQNLVNRPDFARLECG